jgi:hypothetical protein
MSVTGTSDVYLSVCVDPAVRAPKFEPLVWRGLLWWWCARCSKHGYAVSSVHADVTRESAVQLKIRVWGRSGIAEECMTIPQLNPKSEILNRPVLGGTGKLVKV